MADVPRKVRLGPPLLVLHRLAQQQQQVLLLLIPWWQPEWPGRARDASIKSWKKAEPRASGHRSCGCGLPTPGLPFLLWLLLLLSSCRLFVFVDFFQTERRASARSPIFWPRWEGGGEVGGRGKGGV